MKRDLAGSSGHWFLGMECGATKTSVCLADERGGMAANFQAGPANLRLMSDAQLLRHFRSIRSLLPDRSVAALAIGMAGTRTDQDRQRIAKMAAKVWPGVPLFPTNDLETALAAAEVRTSGRRLSQSGSEARVLVLSGTGSCCYGRTADGRTAKIGGWGHLLGDKGSGYEIGLRAMKAVVYYYDRDARWPSLGQRLLRALQLNEPEQLIGWAQQAAKSEVAALAPEVFTAAQGRDRIARDILEGAAHGLAKDAVACAARLAKLESTLQFVLAGSVLLKQPAFARKVGHLIRQRCPRARILHLTQPGVLGAVRLAQDLHHRIQSEKPASSIENRGSRIENPASSIQHPEQHSLAGLASSPTEQRNPRSMELNRLPLGKAVELMLNEETFVQRALLAEHKAIERGVRMIVRALRGGGRLFYVGAGTSGRLGVLDASECPPTFRTPPDQVQGIMAGGQRAIWSAVEGAEDDPEAGARAVAFRGVTRKDVVVGIASSGRTPFVWGALREAGRRRAATMLITFNSNLVLSRGDRPDLVIAPNVGPELLTGSTRLKAGTATKLILNIFTTLAMVQLGKVRSNLMIDVKASNSKLRDRAARIVRELTQVDYKAAWSALEKSGWDIKSACRRVGSRS